MGKYHLILLFIALIAREHFVHSQTDCNPRSFDQDSFVCVCNADSCDFIGTIDTPPAGSYRRIISSRDEFRFAVFDGVEETVATGNTTIHINHDLEYQTMIGFGGAFTDATGINIVALSPNAQDFLMRSYFAPEGIEYNLCRIPVGGSDFSTRPYTYDDDHPGDVDLEFFALEPEDFDYKIPVIQQAIALSAKNFLLFASPWSPPAWMKTNNMINETGSLLREMWDPYTNYLIKFIEIYEGFGIPIWGLTPQNEPNDGTQIWLWNSCGWTPEEMRDWIKTSMGPIFTAAGLRRIKVMVLDHNRNALPWYPATILEDPEAYQYVDGVAVHWYDDAYFGPEKLTEIKTMFPEKFLIYTEACEPFDGRPMTFGSWGGAEHYASNILEDINHFSTGWVDWNMVLDMLGGPNWVSNFVDAPIIVNAETDEFYKQPKFYAMGHFSKFVLEGAKRIYTRVEGDEASIFTTAFHNPDNTEAVVILNTANYSIAVSIESHLGDYINIVVNPKSIETILLEA